MLSKIIDWSGRNRFLVLLATLFIVLAGVFAVLRTPIDALPDLSDVQVIVYTEVPGQAPQVVEDQVTYPLTSAMLSVPKSKVVRGFSFFGASFVYIIFEDGTDIYWARSRVLEYLNFAAGRMPSGITPQIGPDATGVGWVYQYALLAKDKTLAELRGIQDWYLRYQLTKAHGVAEVASVGGFVQTYQVTVDPVKLRAYGIPLMKVAQVIRDSNRDVGGRAVEMAETEYMVRGKGYLRDRNDIGLLVLKADKGTPVLVRDVARVELIPDERRGLTELNGEGEVVSGIAMARYGQNALEVIANLKDKIAEIGPGLPEGVTVQTVYDRSELIERAIGTLKRTLTEESLIVAAVCVVFLMHVRSALVAILMLPVGILMAFIAMRLLGMSSNLMSLGGIAIAIGAMIDAAIVMIENAHKHLEKLGSDPDSGSNARSGQANPTESGSDPNISGDPDSGSNARPGQANPTESGSDPNTSGDHDFNPGARPSGSEPHSVMPQQSMRTHSPEWGSDPASDSGSNARYGQASPTESGSDPNTSGDHDFNPGARPSGSEPHSVMPQQTMRTHSPEWGSDPASDSGSNARTGQASPAASGSGPDFSQRARAILQACKEVGPALFFSLLIITVSFLPVFSLEGQEGRLFSPLAYTKTFSMAAASLLSVTLVPVLMLLFIRGKVMPEAKNPVNRFLIWAYRPMIQGVMRWKKTTLALAVLALLASWYPASRLGSEFMPTLNEGSLLYMPASLPGMSITKAAELLQTQDKIIKSFPEVASVYGKAGRANTATDPAPPEMFETVINLKPESEWRAGMSIDKLIAELDRALQFPGVANSWTMPIKARIDMLSTGIRTPIGIKVFGKDLEQMEQLARQIEAVVKKVPGTSSAFAERITGGFYLEIEPDRAQLARYGLSVGELQDVIGAALGGEMVTTTVQGRERYGVTLRYPRELRGDPQAIAREVLVPTMDGAMVALGQLARVTVAKGAPGIRTENALLSAYIYVDIRERDIGGYVAQAKQAVAEQVQFPPGYYVTWSGQFENMEHAIEKMKVVIPVTLLIIFLLLYLNFRRITETLIVMLSVPFALVGGVWLMWLLGYNLSVAVAVGFIALAGVAAETGVIMLIYLDHAWEDIKRQCREQARAPTVADLYAAVMEGAVERVRPKMMTVVAIMAGLLPILWGSGTGSEVMSRIAAPMVGGMLSSTVLTLAVIPAIYALVKQWRLGRGLEG